MGGQIVQVTCIINEKTTAIFVRSKINVENQSINFDTKEKSKFNPDS